VTYNKYFNTRWASATWPTCASASNCDILQQNVNPLAVKKITRATLRRFGSMYWHCLAGQTVFPVQTAVRYRVPLIIWGAHQGLEQVGMFSHEHEVEMTRRHRKDHDLMGWRPTTCCRPVRHADRGRHLAVPLPGRRALRPRSACAASTWATTCAGIRRPSTSR
jgi:hypothetical protein